MMCGVMCLTVAYNCSYTATLAVYEPGFLCVEIQSSFMEMQDSFARFFCREIWPLNGDEGLLRGEAGLFVEIQASFVEIQGSFPEK